MTGHGAAHMGRIAQLSAFGLPIFGKPEPHRGELGVLAATVMLNHYLGNAAAQDGRSFR
jgi:hypothetical protein